MCVSLLLLSALPSVLLLLAQIIPFYTADRVGWYNRCEGAFADDDDTGGYGGGDDGGDDDAGYNVDNGDGAGDGGDDSYDARGFDVADVIGDGDDADSVDGDR